MFVWIENRLNEPPKVTELVHRTGTPNLKSVPSQRDSAQKNVRKTICFVLNTMLSHCIIKMPCHQTVCVLEAGVPGVNRKHRLQPLEVPHDPPPSNSRRVGAGEIEEQKH